MINMIFTIIVLTNKISNDVLDRHNELNEPSKSNLSSNHSVSSAASGVFVMLFWSHFFLP